MKKKDYVLLPSPHHGGMWFLIEILHYRLGYLVKNFREVLQDDMKNIAPPQTITGHYTAFGPMGSGIINIDGKDGLQALYNVLNKDNGCLTVIPFRDVLSCIISARRRDPPRNSDWLVSEFVAIAQESHRFNPIYFPLDLNPGLDNEGLFRYRLNLFNELEEGLGVKLEENGDLYKNELARLWPPNNMTTTYCLHTFGKANLEIKKAQEQGDKGYLAKTMPPEWNLLMEKQPILQPWFENFGYKDLLWFE